MKQLLALLLFFITSSIAVTAQTVEAQPPSGTATSSTDAPVREATEKLVAKYTLNADQAKQMYAIQQRKQRNLGEITPLQTSNYTLYLSKLESLQRGTLASIRRILRTKEQIELYQSTQRDVRVQRAEKRKELAQKSTSKEETQAALLGIYAE